MDKYVWWNVSELQEQGLFAMILSEGAKNLRLEFHRRHEDGENRLVLVSAESGEPCGSYNVSHTCPPDCP